LLNKMAHLSSSVKRKRLVLARMNFIMRKRVNTLSLLDCTKLYKELHLSKAMFSYWRRGYRNLSIKYIDKMQNLLTEMGIEKVSKGRVMSIAKTEHELKDAIRKKAIYQHPRDETPIEKHKAFMKNELF